MSNFRILSLSGGGARGLFQAHFLSRIAASIDTRLYEHFDLIIGTSIGSINGLGVSLDIEPRRLVELFDDRADEIFGATRFTQAARALIGGPLYQQEPLKNALVSLFGDRTLSDCKRFFVAAATSLVTYNATRFSNFLKEAGDSTLKASDVALASSSAPFFFRPHTLDDGHQSFVDGGVWANSPCLAAILIAHRSFNIPFEAMRVLSLGTGQHPHGSTLERFIDMRLASPEAMRTLSELMLASQMNYTETMGKELVGAGRFFHINPTLQEPIGLHNVSAAKKLLPSHGMSEADNFRKLFSDMFPPSANTEFSPLHEGRLATHEMIAKSGLSKLIPKRKYYQEFRLGSGPLESYLGTAQSSIKMISINLATGINFENILRVFDDKIENSETFSVCVSLLNPDNHSLMNTVSETISIDSDGSEQARVAQSDGLRDAIKQSLARLIRFRENLPTSSRGRFGVQVHNAFPLGSAILLDCGLPSARIQIETKVYKAAMSDSFAFEVVDTGPDSLYVNLKQGYTDLLNDGLSMV